MAIEDAVSLATLLPRDTKMSDIPARLLAYEKGRRPRVDMVLEYTRLNGRDENDISARRISGEFNADSEHARANHGYIVVEMVQVMSKCFNHNEIKASGSLLETLLPA